MLTSCTVVFLISPIPTTFQSEIIKKMRNSNLKCGTSIGDGSIERKLVSSD